MSYSDPYTFSPFDQQLADTSELSWVPWVGRNYANLPESRKVLIVAESHYSNEQDRSNATLSIKERVGYKTYTRAVVSESLIGADWTTRTLSTMHQLFYSPVDRDAFWNDVAFFNIVQRPMWYRDGNPERPTWEDFWAGWEAFLKAVEILKPDHVLFIGVEAANHFNGFMHKHGHEHIAVEWAEKVGSAYARTANLSLDAHQIPLHFIKHCGSYFSTDRWSDYLHRNSPDLMASLAISAGVKPHEPASRQLHVLGMAKSSLNLRGAKEQKLELDFLRLAYAVRDLQESGDAAIGYLMVLDPEVAEAASTWIDRYQCGEAVVVLCCQPSPSDQDFLAVEKADNAVGFLSDAHDRGLAHANFDKGLGGKQLRAAIEERHGAITPLHEVLTPGSMPLRIAWDYYGTLPIEA
jgi:hypothetical protein